MKAVADLIVDASAAHRLQGLFDHLEHFAVTGLPEAPQQECQAVWSGELGRHTEATMFRIKALTHR